MNDYKHHQNCETLEDYIGYAVGEVHCTIPFTDAEKKKMDYIVKKLTETDLSKDLIRKTMEETFGDENIDFIFQILIGPD